MIRYLSALLIFCVASLHATETYVYAERGSGPLELDIHYPDSNSKETFPVIFWTHGGGWKQGSKVNCKLVEWLLKEGYAIVSINYRLTDVATYPAQWEDCKDALHWVVENSRAHRLDPNHIVTAGLSAGAHLASLLATRTDHSTPRIRGVLHFYGPADFPQMARYAKKPSDSLNTPGSPVFGLLGGPLRENLDLAREASPVTYLEKSDPPFQIIVGSEDSLMTQRQCKRLCDAATEAGVRASLHEIPGAGHGGKEFNDPVRQKLILQFLKSIQP
ncbi:alpha/beta hydrolase [Verrucomicrobiales bacterium BCK34]|nr:alpha/beta hydrolase [Verrucomicrobiales bacterium BCK34]